MLFLNNLFSKGVMEAATVSFPPHFWLSRCCIKGALLPALAPNVWQQMWAERCRIIHNDGNSVDSCPCESRCVSWCVHYRTAKVKCSMCVCAYHHRSAGHMERTVQPERGSPAGQVKGCWAFAKPGDGTPWERFKCLHLRHLVRLSRGLGFIYLSSTGSGLVRAKWSIESR